MRLCGIYGREDLPCGCIVKHYKGGKIITSGCKTHPPSVRLVCTVCNKEMSKRQLKKHRWTHAY